jgi:ADP-heptose:LPS heptosyltransferase
MDVAPERFGLLLTCEGLGDCLFALGVIRKMHLRARGQHRFDLFTHHPELFQACPYVEQVHSIRDEQRLKEYPHRKVTMFDLRKLPHWHMDTFDFISVPLGLGELSFREKRLEYFPVEEDRADAFDVVLNTSMTWPSRSWALENWQRLADDLGRKGMKVAVVGKDVNSDADGMRKRSPALEGCCNLVNRLSLDQTYYTIRKSRLFASCQNGLSVLAGATDAEIVVLDMSIEWSKRAVYRGESPFHKITYVKGDCDIYCCQSHECPLPENRGVFKCVPGYAAVAAAVFGKLGLA